MKHLNNRILLNPISQENKWGDENPTEIKLGKVAFDYKSENIELCAGDEVYYEQPRTVQIGGQEYLLVREHDLICQK